MTQPKLDPEARVAYFRKHVQQYSMASNNLPEDQALFPRMQIRGQWLELALKMYLEACGIIKVGHDLEKLAKLAEKHGLKLTERDWNNRISKVQKIYYEKKGWNSKYLSRYPDFYENLRAVVTPGHEKMEEMIQRIVDQAEARLNSP